MTFRAIDLSGFTPATLRDQPAPRLEWVAVADLVIDARYQRDLTKPGRRLIQRIANNFDWAKFSPINVAPVAGGKFAVVDGQHRAHALALIGEERAPAYVVPMTPVQQAAAFRAVNSQRKRMELVDTFRAALAEGDDVAVRADAAVTAAGCVLMRAMPSSARRRPGQVFTHALIQRMVREGRDEVVTAALRAVAQSDAGQEDFEGGKGHGLRVWDQCVLAIWLPLLASNQRFLGLPLASVFDEIPWLEWIETDRSRAKLDRTGPSAKARTIGRVEGVLRRALDERRAA
jgi:hypothetical protein